MFLILNAFAASIDGFIIGISLRLANINITKKNILIIFLGNLFVYTFFIFTYYFFKLTFMTKTITTILYLFLAYRSLKNNDSLNYKETKLRFFDCLILTLTHSLDGAIISLNFAYTYTLLYISLIFSITSILTLLIGYYFAKYLKKFKKSNYLATILFILLASINQYF